MRLGPRPPLRFLGVRRTLLGASARGFRAAFGDRRAHALLLFLGEYFGIESFGVGCHWFSRVVMMKAVANLTAARLGS
jgi:hypothetical protein